MASAMSNSLDRAVVGLGSSQVDGLVVVPRSSSVRLSLVRFLSFSSVAYLSASAK
jgi:hypothetical protein